MVPTRNNNTRIPHLVGMYGSSTSSRTWNRHSYGGYIEVVVMPGHIWIFHVSWKKMSLSILIPLPWPLATWGFRSVLDFSPFFSTWESPGCISYPTHGHPPSPTITGPVPQFTRWRTASAQCEDPETRRRDWDRLFGSRDASEYINREMTQCLGSYPNQFI